MWAASVTTGESIALEGEMSLCSIYMSVWTTLQTSGSHNTSKTLFLILRHLVFRFLRYRVSSFLGHLSLGFWVSGSEEGVLVPSPLGESGGAVASTSAAVKGTIALHTATKETLKVHYLSPLLVDTNRR